MSNPFFIFTRTELIYLLVVFLLGIILGATLLNLYLSQQIDRLIYEKNSLENQLEENQKQIENLEKNLEEQKHNFVKSINIKLESDLNKHSQQAVKEKIQNLLSRVPGQEISKIEPLLLRDIINERLINVDDNTFQLHLLYLVLQEDLELYIEVSSR